MSPADAEFGVWSTSAPPAPRLPVLQGPLDTDVAIIGAGYTGLSAALHLAELGVKAVVIEARQPGAGASGRNTGWLEPNWWMKRPADIMAMFGAEHGTALTRWVASGPRLLQRWTDRHGLRLEIANRGLVMATEDKAKATALETEVAEWQSAGVANQYLDQAGVERHIPSRRYAGAMFLPDGLTLNPLSLARELARACLQQGAILFGDSPVSSLVRQQGRWVATTAQGRVTARRLVLATDAYTRRLWPALARAYATWHVAVVASEPYDAIEQALPSNAAFADLGLANVFTLRNAGGRLVTSTFAPLRRSQGASAVATPFTRKFARVLPQLPTPRWALRHYGEVGLSRNMLPRLCAIGDGAWTAYGYSGTGINMALLLGGQLADLAATDRTGEPRYPVTPLEPLPLRRTTTAGLRWVHAPLARHVISRFA